MTHDRILAQRIRRFSRDEFEHLVSLGWFEGERVELWYGAVYCSGSLRRFSRAEYDRMVALGWFENERVELLDGTLVTMSPQTARHAGISDRLRCILATQLTDQAMVRGPCRLAIGDDSEPTVDVAVVDRGDYSSEHPSWAWLVIEVADSPLAIERGIKIALYAARSLPEYWIVDLAGRAIEVYTIPRGDQYRSVVTHDTSDTITVGQFPDCSFPVSAILESPRARF